MGSVWVCTDKRSGSIASSNIEFATKTQKEEAERLIDLNKTFQHISEDK